MNLFPLLTAWRVNEAIRAIGPYATADATFDVDAHIAELSPRCPSIVNILSDDPRVRHTAAAYNTLDRAAKKAKCRFECSMSLLALFALLFALVAMFLSVVPHDLGPALRFGIAVVSGFFIAEFAIILARRFQLSIEQQRKWLRPLLAVVFSALVFWFVPVSLHGSVENLRNASIVLLALTLIGADASSGGPIAQMFHRITPAKSITIGAQTIDVSRKPLKQRWYELRGHAEDHRRRFFQYVVQSKSSATAKDILSLKLEYVRRFHIEVQQAYFSTYSEENKIDANIPLFLKFAALLVSMASGLYLFLLYLALLSEQDGGATFLMPDVAAGLITMTRDGFGDLALLASLFAIGLYGYAQLTTILLQKTATHERFANAWAQLRRATSPKPGVAELELALPLSKARLAAVAGDEEAVLDLVRQVNRLLGAEFGGWSPTSHYKIQYIEVNGRTASRLLSTARISPDTDFEWITRDLDHHGFARRPAQKTGLVRASRAVGGELVEANGYDGFQSEATAQPGDYIVTKLDRALQAFRNAEGKLDQWVVPPKVFRNSYIAASPTDTELFRPTERAIEVLPFEGGIDILMPSGDHQSIPNGYLVRNGEHVYGIDAASFHATYDFLDLTPASA